MRLTTPLLTTLLCGLIGTGCPDAPPEDPPPAQPSFALCDAIITQRECFAASCSFFTNASTLVFPGGANTCERTGGFGACLYTKAPEGPDRLTHYQRVLDDGTRRTLQLGYDVELEGWTRCGAQSAPPDCDCGGKL